MKIMELLKLADLIEFDIDEREFIMGAWEVEDMSPSLWAEVAVRDGRFNAEKAFTIAHGGSCKTARCVAGWAAFMFKNQGYDADLSDYATNADRFADFFEISILDAVSICLNEFELSKEEKAQQIRKVAHKYLNKETV